jgi:YbbR domain-containing protein
MMTPKNLAQNVMHVVFRNIGWRILSLALATLVWIAIHREPTILAVLPAPVQFKNSPADLEISSEIVEAVDLETRGPAELLRNLSEKRVAVVLDFSTVRDPGERTFTIERKNTNLPRGVDLVRIIPSQIRFNFERRIVRKVPVEPQVSGTLPRGLRLVSTLANPPELAITGPESKVRGVATLRTDPVNLNGISEDKSMRVTAYLPNSQLRFKDPPEVTVKVSVEK